MLTVRQKVIGGAVIALFVIGVVDNSTNHRVIGGRADLTVSPWHGHIPPGGDGVINVRLGNAGPDALDNTVKFTVSATDHLTIRNPGVVVGAVRPDRAFSPRSDCDMTLGQRLMTCTAQVSLSASHREIWRIPVHVDRGTPATSTLRLTVTGGGSEFTDLRTGNNTNVPLIVMPARAGAAPPSSRPTHRSPPPSRSASPPPRTGSSSPSPSPSSSRHDHGTTHRVDSVANKVLAPVAIALCLLVGIAAIFVAWLVIVARRQREGRR
jgi:hypothetical protein